METMEDALKGRRKSERVKMEKADKGKKRRRM